MVKELLSIGSGFSIMAGILMLALWSDQRPALAEQANSDSHHDHHHHHHEVAPGFERSEGAYSIPAVTMTNQHGQAVSLQELLDSDQPVMLNFIFTSCTAICPTMSGIFAGVQTKLGSDSKQLRMVSISIDPEYDTPEALNAYARRFEAGPQWIFLTGSLDDTIAVQRAFDADRGDKMNHSPMTLLRASRDSEWVRYEGFASANELVKECRSML